MQDDDVGETVSLRLSEQMAVMAAQMNNLVTSVGEMRTDVRKLSDEAPIHRIRELEQWRDETKRQVQNVPELVRWKTNIGRALTALAVGVFIALAGVIFSIILAR